MLILNEHNLIYSIYFKQMIKTVFHKFLYFIDLGRYNNLSGAFLLMWPCFWGLTYNGIFDFDFVKYFFLFFVGAIVMRGAGCTFNDIIDSKIDAKVKRTKNRPIASKKITVVEGLFFLFLQLLVGFVVLINFDIKVIFSGLLILPFIFIYPYLKRLTFFPQIFLGLIFNWGIFLGYFCNYESIDIGVIYLYFAGVFLTTGYDTIYGYQDINDDTKIGVKSLSIKTKNYPKRAVGFVYILSLIFLFLSVMQTNKVSYLNIIFLFIIGFCLYFQIKKINLTNKNQLMNIFKSNVYLGGIIFVLFLFNNFNF